MNWEQNVPESQKCAQNIYMEHKSHKDTTIDHEL